ncbi:DUF2513 domain-containing protein [Schleiferilactobacillus harbinensis]|uniref:DUF2513 domain-containing protein n=1 Tax=Schleiferilactobacillus harbinensis TaxID=304207 RepID=A0A5P8M5W4_9LACO|nr:DUF2513 domain-containing protein [Schleiferilactobacillus harbinensis]QFR23727.1 DUF2513 domain-containing protein [Schleiferilactobacillus harbinensis]
MELNHDKVRLLMLAMEKSQDVHGMDEAAASAFGEKNGLSRDQLAYMVACLNEGGLISGKVTWGNNQPMWIYPGNLTFKGQEYLDNIRDPEIWKQTKSIASKAGSVSLDLMSSIAAKVITKTLGLE